ncbi:MAG TPA: DUF1259 domain-containing protein [Burkholderiales bacterium]|nr:DUF1259 domain-containing protein [Burkholderiales bacterium]
MPNILAAVLVLLFSAAAFSAPGKIDSATIEQTIGAKGTYSGKENVFKVSSPRADIQAQVDGWAMPPFMGLTSYAAFTPTKGNQLMLMGDTVLLQDEVNPAMDAAFASGLEVTALHNHFFFDQPKVYFMHIGGTGDARKLATGVKNVWDRIKEVRAANKEAADRFAGDPIPAKSSISAVPLEKILGTQGQASNGMFKAVWGLTARMHGVRFGKEMGLNTWAAFAGSDENAVVDGDFAMHENELQSVLRTMRKEGVNVVAIHSHMSSEQPRILFMHYWGRGKAADLAQSLHNVLAAQRAAGEGKMAHGG